jgi:tRNA pseudouridine38-40 synthase
LSFSPQQDDPPPGHVRLKMRIAYDGTAFSGWQSQAGGKAVQDALEGAFKHLVGRRVVVHGSGRTDSGVHALGQVAHADVPVDRLPVGAWAGALNAHLVREVRVLETVSAPRNFHARFSATGKTYLYRIWNHRFQNPLERHRSWHVATPLDRTLLRNLAEALEGTHDFAAFAANRGSPEKCTVRTLSRVRVHSKAGMIGITFSGDGFLYRMVRLLTGTLVRVAQGKRDADWMLDLLHEPDGRKSSFCAPADGLFLQTVRYGVRGGRRASEQTPGSK